MKTWYRKISRDLDRPQGYLPRFNTDEREEPKPQTVTSPIIDTVETEEENSRTEEDSQSAHTTSPQTTSFKNKDEFKATMLPIYAKILSQMGLNTAYAKMLVAQDGLESAWGTKPSGKFNFGGIKGTGSIKRTREVIDGKDVYINDSFRDFASLEDYAKYKISLLNNNRYKAFTGDLSGFADRVSRGGYATDPNYAETLKRVIASAKHGGILKFQAGGTGEIRPDNRSWFKRKWDDIATAYNSSSWANSAPARFTPYGLFHYSASGDEDSASAVGTKEVAKNAVKEGVNLVYRHYGNDIQGALKWLRNARKGSIPAAERLEVPKQISKIRLGNPKHEYTLEEVRELRNKNHTGDYLIRTKNQYYKSIPEKVEPIEKAIDLNLYKGAEELFERYNDSTIQSLLNDVAQVRSAINYAKAGLKIPKYQNPASTMKSLKWLFKSGIYGSS